MHLPHGKWLLFTLASLSLPYAEDFGPKAKKRLIATAVGGAVSMVLYSLIPSIAGRNAVMMASGYLSSFMPEYTGTFACSTVGALGGAVFTSTFGWQGVGQILLIRLEYLCLGIGIAYLANCLILPYQRKQATIHLWRKYDATTELLSRVCRHKAADPQLYYSLVIHAHLEEEMLYKNAKAQGWDAKELLARCREKVRSAHREAAEMGMR